MSEAKDIAAAWRQEHGGADLKYLHGGVVVIYNGQVQSWVNELRDPGSWRPGCIAVDSDGIEYAAVGGDDDLGADAWERRT